MKVLSFQIRWANYSGATLYCEVKSGDDSLWSYIGSVTYFPGNWLSKLIYPKRFAAGTPQGEGEMFRTLTEAQQFVEDNAVWP